jgi:hypothetical protein
VGRNARDIARCHDLVLAKHRPALLRYPPALSSELVYRGHRLAARFALSNRDRGLAAFYLALAGVRAPLHVALVTSRLMRRRLRVGRPA